MYWGGIAQASMSDLNEVFSSQRNGNVTPMKISRPIVVMTTLWSRRRGRIARRVWAG
jgi:hypothetical protein